MTDATSAMPWDDRHAAICRRHRDVVAVYGWPGRYALLLRQTLVPLGDEREAWLTSTRRTARAVVEDLRSAGLRTRFVVLQWWSLERVSGVLEAWPRVHDTDPVRREQHARIVARYLADRMFLDSRRNGPVAAGRVQFM